LREVLVAGKRWSLTRQDVDDLAATTGAELHGPADQREQGVVTPATDPVAGMEVGATLTDDDLAGVDRLATEALDAEALCVRVATVLGRGNALLGCHEFCP